MTTRGPFDGKLFTAFWWLGLFNFSYDSVAQKFAHDFYGQRVRLLFTILASWAIHIALHGFLDIHLENVLQLLVIIAFPLVKYFRPSENDDPSAFILNKCLLQAEIGKGQFGRQWKSSFAVFTILAICIFLQFPCYWFIGCESLDFLTEMALFLPTILEFVLSLYCIRMWVNCLDFCLDGINESLQADLRMLNSREWDFAIWKYRVGHVQTVRARLKENMKSTKEIALIRCAILKLIRSCFKRILEFAAIAMAIIYIRRDEALRKIRGHWMVILFGIVIALFIFQEYCKLEMRSRETKCILFSNYVGVSANLRDEMDELMNFFLVLEPGSLGFVRFVGFLSICVCAFLIFFLPFFARTRYPLC